MAALQACSKRSSGGSSTFPSSMPKISRNRKKGVLLFATLDDEESLRYAREHRDVIARYGRFPHRNRMLGRVSTAEEEAYLARPGAGFGYLPDDDS